MNITIIELNKEAWIKYALQLEPKNKKILLECNQLENHVRSNSLLQDFLQVKFGIHYQSV